MALSVLPLHLGSVHLLLGAGTEAAQIHTFLEVEPYTSQPPHMVSVSTHLPEGTSMMYDDLLQWWDKEFSSSQFFAVPSAPANFNLILQGHNTLSQPS